MFIQELYYGNLDAQEQHASNHHAERQALEKLCAAEKEFLASLDSASQERFHLYRQAYDLFHCEANHGAFETGFRLGAQCMMDILSTP